MLFMFSFSGFSQEQGTVIVRKNQDSISIISCSPKDSSLETIFVDSEKMPEFPGGQEKLYQYIRKKVTYPDSIKNKNIEGRVYVQFVVEKDGAITNVEVVRGLEKSLNEISVKAIKEMPNWIPGEQRGKKVRIKYTMPILFKLG